MPRTFSNFVMCTNCIYGFHTILRISSGAYLYNIIQLIFVMMKCCVFLEVGPEYLNIILMCFGFKGLK